MAKIIKPDKVVLPSATTASSSVSFLGASIQLATNQAWLNGIRPVKRLVRARGVEDPVLREDQRRSGKGRSR